MAQLLEGLESVAGSAFAARAGVLAGLRPGSALPLLLRASSDVASLLFHAETYWSVLTTRELVVRTTDEQVEVDILSGSERRRGDDLYASFLVGMLVGALRNAGVSPLGVALPGVTVLNGTSESVLGVVATGGADRARVTLSASDLTAPLESADALVARHLAAGLGRSYAALRSAISWQIDELIRERLGEGLSMPEAARRLGLSERTLRRRLDDEGTSFRERLDHVRRIQALELLTHEAVGPVAKTLGFVDARSFQRAFRRWTDMTPREYQRRASS